ncbi:MAG: class I SAM-dependent methyltransferase [Verrucomicrobiota bacterium]
MNTEAAPSESFEFEALQVAVNYREAIFQEMQPYLGPRILEVGAGIGQFSRVLLKNRPQAELTALEPDGDFFAQLSALKSKCTVLHGETSMLAGDFQADTVINVNVLEHIEDHIGELSRYRRILQERNGALCLFVPARQELYAPLDRDFGHFRRYSKTSMLQALAAAGLAAERMHYFNFPGYFLWWLNFKAMKTRKFSIKNVKAFDRFCLPVIHYIESNIIRPPLGQSLLAIARPE